MGDFLEKLKYKSLFFLAQRAIALWVKRGQGRRLAAPGDFDQNQNPSAMLSLDVSL